MIEMDADAFDALVTEELDLLPDEMIDGLDNVVFVVEDRPEDGSLDLLGLYDGLALTERDRYGVGELPDRIIVYRDRTSTCATTSRHSATRCTRRSCTRSRISTASTTRGCTNWGGHDPPPRRSSAR